MQARTELTEEEVKQYAWQAVRYAQQQLPFGSVNKQSDEPKLKDWQLQVSFSKMRNSKEITSDTLKIPFTNRKERKLLLYRQRAAIYAETKVGNCREHMTIALVYLKDQEFDDVDVCSMSEGDHEFLLMNGKIICDPWANDVYHVREFAAKREAAKSMRYSYLVYEERPEIKPYLFGVPCVKFATGNNPGKSIVNGQFVRCGEDLKIDYSEYVATIQQELLHCRSRGISVYEPRFFTVFKTQEAALVSSNIKFNQGK